MKNVTISQRITLIFALLLVAICSIYGFLIVRNATQYSHVVIQRLSESLAQHIVSSNALQNQDGWDKKSLATLFDQLMAVNPSVEVYLIDRDGNIITHAAPAGHLKRHAIDLTPVKALLSGAAMPVYGDDPRTLGEKKVFSAAPIKVNNEIQGYLYVILLGEAYDSLVNGSHLNSLIDSTIWAMLLAVVFVLLVGMIAFRWITRPVRQLTQQVNAMDEEGIIGLNSLKDDNKPFLGLDEVGQLQKAFRLMAERISQQLRILSKQDLQRREFVATISHDLRTPLTALHGYLEILSVKESLLTAAERQHYLDMALSQSHKVGQLAQDLFELARLEYGVVKPKKELFSIRELVQDVTQKFELAAEAKKQKISIEVHGQIPMVYADLSMIERVLANLIDNAITYTPLSSKIDISLWVKDTRSVMVEVCDNGPGIAAELRESLFSRPSGLYSYGRVGGGFGLMIVKNILILHDCDIVLVVRPQEGACFQFSIPTQ